MNVALFPSGRLINDLAFLYSGHITIVAVRLDLTRHLLETHIDALGAAAGVPRDRLGEI